MKGSSRVPWLTVEAASQEIATLSIKLATEQDFRAKQRLGRRLAFAGTSVAVAKVTLDLPVVDMALNALKLARKAGGTTGDLYRSFAWLSKLRLDALGCANARIIAEARKTVPVDTGCLAASAVPSLTPDSWIGPNVSVLAAMNRGEFFLIGLGADGRYRVSVRIVDAPEPVLKPDEYKLLDGATDIGVLRIANKELRCGAPENMEIAAKVAAPNGLMKVQLFRLSRANTEKFILIGCAANEAPTPLEQIPEIR
jgi:hypothetical protein